MKERQKKLTMNTSGENAATNRKTTTYTLGIPTTWVTELGLSEFDRDILLYFDEEKQEIIIEKNPESKEKRETKAMKAEYEKIKKAKQRMFEMETREKSQRERLEFKMELKRRMDQEQRDFEAALQERIEKERKEFFEKIDREFA